MFYIIYFILSRWGRKSTTYLSFLLVLVASVLVGVLEFFPNMEGFHFFCTFFVTCIIEFISLLQRGFFGKICFKNSFKEEKVTCYCTIRFFMHCFSISVFQLGVALVGKCAIALGFLCIYMWSSEIYPTVVRLVFITSLHSHLFKIFIFWGNRYAGYVKGICHFLFWLDFQIFSISHS